MTTRVTKQSVGVLLVPEFVPKKIRTMETNLQVAPESTDHEDFIVVSSQTFETVSDGTFRTKIR